MEKKIIKKQEKPFACRIGNVILETRATTKRKALEQVNDHLCLFDDDNPFLPGPFDRVFIDIDRDAALGDLVECD